jgi:ABC-type antimicrobial peptide transport system permease subunit
VVRQGTGAAAIGLAAGLVSALGAATAARGQFYGATAYDPSAYAIAAAVLLAAAVVACLAPAFRATRVDPATMLRAE